MSGLPRDRRHPLAGREFCDKQKKLYLSHPHIIQTNNDGSIMFYRPNQPIVGAKSKSRSVIGPTKMNQSNGEVYKLAEETIVKKPAKSENRLFWFLKRDKGKSSPAKKTDLSVKISQEMRKNKEIVKTPARSKSFETNSSIR